MDIKLTGTGSFRLNGQPDCHWLPDDAVHGYNCVFIGDRVILTGSWDGDEKDDGLIRLVLDNTTIGAYYASHDLVNDVWTLEVDITYLLKDLTEPYTGWGATIDNTAYDTKTYTPRTLLVYTENNNTVSCTVDIVILGGHKLSAMQRPLFTEMMNTVPEDANAIAAISRVQPPNVILNIELPISSTGIYPVWVECLDSWAETQHTPTNGNYIVGTAPTLSNGNGGSVGLDPQTSVLWWHGKNKKHCIPIQKINGQQCDSYAIVRWKSKTGNWRQHIFEVKNITDNLDGSTVIDNIGTSYRSLVENSYQFDIHLSGLTRYSLWYYQDILSSEEIYCCVMNTQFNEWLMLCDLDESETLPTAAPSELLCSVTSPKKYTVPNGNGQLYDFYCTLKYKKTTY